MYKIYGRESAISITKEDLDFFDLEIEFDEDKSKKVETQNSRGNAELIELGDIKDYDLVSIEYDDGGSWIFTAEEYEKYVNTKTNRGGDGLIIDPYLQGTSRSLGSIKEEILEFIKFKVVGKLVNEVANKIETKLLVPEEGLFSVDSNVKKIPLLKFNLDAGPYLLLLHGTISSIEGSFGKFRKSSEWTEIFSHYDGRVIALEHKTLSKGVIENAKDLIGHLPKGITVDILSGSRGGLIGEIFTALVEETDKDVLENGFPEIINRLNLEELRTECQAKEIKINKSVRVSCPGGGTSLLGNSIPDFLQAFNNISKVLDKAGTPGKIFKGLKILITSIVNQKDNQAALPGLNDMIPTTDFIHDLNTSEYFNTPLFVISGQHDNPKVESIKRILHDWIFNQANDLVVDTASMIGGLRRNRITEFRSPDSVTHFDYFKNEKTRAAIKIALQSDGSNLNLSGFMVPQSNESSRGVIDMGETPPNPKDNTLGYKPIIVLLPGVLGSTLHHKDKRLWMKLFRLMDNGIGKLAIKPNDGIKAKAGIGDAYNKFVDHFRKNYDVIVFPYDWRKSIQEAGKLFNSRIKELLAIGVPVHIVAHSMGGLVARELMMEKAGLHKQLESRGGRIIMLGTPWKGSYLIPEALNACGKRFGQLRKVALCSHSKSELLEVLVKFEGIYSLLPMYGRDFGDPALWKEMNLLAKIPASNLRWFKKYKADFLAMEDQILYKNIYYIAGYAERTVDEYRMEKGSVKFYSVPQRPGDSSVTWDSGIPTYLKKNHLYFTNTEHGELCNDPELFEGIRQLIEFGEVENNKFFNSRDGIDISKTRSGMPDFSSAVLSNKPDDIIKDILGLKNSYSFSVSKPIEKVTIQIVNGDLKYAKFPVMIGHFHKDEIISAESVMDALCEGLLTERNKLGAYPGQLGTSFVLPPQNTTNPGTVILGLGLKQEINPERLQRSVEQGVIEYLLHPEIKNKEGISTLMVGSGYGNIVLSECLNAIIKGVLNANKRFKEVFPEGKIIKNIEVIELYKDRAERAFEFIAKNEKTYFKSNIHLAKTLVSDFGRRELSDYGREKKWWKSVTVKNPSEGEHYGKIIEFTLSSDIARVDQSVIEVDVSLVDRLIGEITPNTPWDSEQIQAAFKLLIPNALRLILNGNNSIIWILDRFTAKYPWELLHFNDLQERPTSVEAGMIRQLTFKKVDRVASYVNSNEICVVADPILNEELAADQKLSQLDGAVKEGEMVVSRFKNHGFNVSQLIRKEEKEIFPKLLLNRFKILHFACHGVVGFGDEKKTGIVVNYNSIITPEILANLDYMPDFIFVNCCYSGFIGEGTQNSFSPNIGTTLIENGVKAIIVGAWEINDSAAYYFADEFYNWFLQGEYFGAAVRMAREACYLKYKTKNTWGAFQCYGNQYYQLGSNHSSYKEERNYKLEKDILIDLEKLKNKTKYLGARKNGGIDFKEDLFSVSKRIERSGLRTSTISEKEAYIYADIGDYGSAIELYEKMMNSTDLFFTLWARNYYRVIKSKYIITQVKGGRFKATEVKLLKHLLDESRKAYEESPTKGHGEMYTSVYKSYLMSWNLDENKASKAKVDKFKKDYRKELKCISDLYLDISRKEKEITGQENTHLFCMYVVIASMTSNNVSSIKKAISKEISIDIDEYLVELLNQTDKYKKRNFWDEIKSPNILEAQLSLLVGTEEDKMIKISEEIKSQYQEAWNFGGSRRNLMAEIDQLDFTIKSVEITDSYAENLRAILLDLRTFYKGLEIDGFGGKVED